MATTFTCPKGHASADNDFCSECGAKIQGGNSPAAVVSEPPSGRLCPDCGAPVPGPGVNFCEICGYNFLTQTSGQLPIPVPPVSPPAPPAPTVQAFTLVIAVDPSLRAATSPEAPVDPQPVIYRVDKPTNLLGRKSDARAIFPDIPLDSDTAISHRHGVISQTLDGILSYRDLESSNGTKLNGTDVTPLADIPLKAGDQLTLGHWTRITVTAN
jgi:hypothetical protein